MKQNNNDLCQWDECPAGTLTKPATEIRHSKQVRRGVLLSSGVIVLIMAVGSQMLDHNQQPVDRSPLSPAVYQEPNYGGVTCSVIRENAADYKAGRLSSEMCAKMEDHVGQCAICSNLLSRRRAMDDQLMIAQVLHARQ